MVRTTRKCNCSRVIFQKIEEIQIEGKSCKLEWSTKKLQTFSGESWMEYKNSGESWMKIMKRNFSKNEVWT